MVRALVKVFTGLVALVITALLCAVLVGVLIFKDERITAGSAYGFVIGESNGQAFERATRLRDAGEIAEIRRSPMPSREFAFDASQLADASHDRLWVMAIEPTWYTYRDTITLEFQNNRVSAIYRFRSCCELP